MTEPDEKTKSWASTLTQAGKALSVVVWIAWGTQYRLPLANHLAFLSAMILAAILLRRRLIRLHLTRGHLDAPAYLRLHEAMRASSVQARDVGAPNVPRPCGVGHF